MRPKLNAESMKAITALGNKGPGECDGFELTVGQKITNLSMAIDKGNATIADLESKLEESRELNTKQVGEYVAWCEALASYGHSKQAEAQGNPPVPIVAEGGVMPGDTDPEATPEPGPEAKGPQDTTDGPQDEAPEPGPTGQDEAEKPATTPKPHRFG